MIDTYVSQSDWANLPKNLLDSIVERFSSSSDYLRFSVVCTSWLDVAKHNQARFAEKLLRHQEPPMLLFFNDNKAAWNLYNVVDDKVLDVQLNLSNRRFCGSSRGWLVHVGKDYVVTLTKPVFYKSNKRGKREDVVVRLPKLNPPNAKKCGRDINQWGDYYVIKATIKGDPILDEDKYIVVLSYMSWYEVAFIRPSKDTRWTNLYTDVIGVTDMLPHGGVTCYALQCSGNLLTFAFSSKPKAKSVQCELPCKFPRKKSALTNYLVDSGNNLQMVKRYYDFEVRNDFDTRFARDFKAFEFDFDNCKWIKKKTLGEDVALFVGENITISVAASNFPGLKQHCIYYNHDPDTISYGNELLHDFGVYDMEKKTISKPYSKH